MRADGNNSVGLFFLPDFLWWWRSAPELYDLKLLHHIFQYILEKTEVQEPPKEIVYILPFFFRFTGILRVKISAHICQSSSQL